MMKRVILVAAALAGCGNGGGVGPSTFAMINTQTLQPSCAFTDTCHTAAGAHAAGNLNLKTDPYSALVNVTVDNTVAKGQGLVRVKPNDSTNSFLYQKLAVIPACNGACSCNYMSPGPNNIGLGTCMPNTSSPLDSATIAGIKKWIDDGAMNN
jgi:hypothetical protein